jgi:hypothetical protein
MNSYIPRANCFRGYPINDGFANIIIDYTNRLPIIDLMQLREQYQAGIYPINIYPDWKVNEEIAIQFQYDRISSRPSIANIYNESGLVATMTWTNITPLGWVGYDVSKFTYTPTVSGYYYIEITYLETGSRIATIRTDTFYVSDSLSDDKNLLELQFYSDENINGFVFDQYYKAYYTGQWEPSDPDERSSIFDEDLKAKLAAIEYDKIKITLTEIHISYYSVIAKQLQNKNLKLNGLSYIYESGISLERTEKTDVVNIIFELTANYDNDFMTIN